ncbi:unnamed protein product [Tetraodon nigroviridis]|uniref:(spotted green pufferfish) hypothetical protein n=1 Tax=Tetraodon nigroviridis TaxID=99883 RepID=Q4SWL7_TETNG|nr:unnamed protein product [Tetraodon nigroviridis]
MGAGWWLTAPLLCCLTGMKCGGDAALVYGRVGGRLLLPCANLLLSDCSSISWTFFGSGGSWNSVEIRQGPAEAGSQVSKRISLTSNCSLSLRDLQEDDAGSYTCSRDGHALVDHHLSLLTITSLSAITSLQPGGNLSLSCVLLTYYDAGNCRSQSVFNLSWVSGDGTSLPSDNRTRLVDNSRCSVTLVTSLGTEDNNRKWRCQVSTKEEAGVVFLLFRSTFVFDSSGFGGTPPGSALDRDRDPPRPPLTRILLFVAATVVVVTAGVSMWR